MRNKTIETIKYTATQTHRWEERRAEKAKLLNGMMNAITHLTRLVLDYKEIASEEEFEVVMKQLRKLPKIVSKAHGQDSDASFVVKLLKTFKL